MFNLLVEYVCRAKGEMSCSCNLVGLFSFQDIPGDLSICFSFCFSDRGPIFILNFLELPFSVIYCYIGDKDG